MVSLNVQQQRSPPHFATPLRVHTPSGTSASSSPSSQRGSSPPSMGLLTVARHHHQHHQPGGYSFPDTPPSSAFIQQQSGHHLGLPPSIPRPTGALLTRPLLPSGGGSSVITPTSMAQASTPSLHANSGPVSMEQLWENAERGPLANPAGRPDSQVLDYSVCPGRTVIVASNGGSGSGGGSNGNGGSSPTSNDRMRNGGSGGQVGHSMHDSRMEVEEEDDTPMICMICEDKATGLHYGIITCEG